MLGTRPGDVAVATETLVPRGSAPRGIADNLELSTQALKEPAIVQLGPEARALADRDGRGTPLGSAPAEHDGSAPESHRLAVAEDGDEANGAPFRDYPLYGKTAEPSSTQSHKPPNDLTEEEQEDLEELKARDREVRAHEQTHKATAGKYAGQITYELERGPDGRSYAVDGEVAIDVSPVAGDPTATVAKMKRVRRAALGPADPSGADHHVAAQAALEAQQARLEIARRRYGGSEPAAGFPADGAETDPASRDRPSLDVRA
jgi:hypothetical protein